MEMIDSLKVNDAVKLRGRPALDKMGERVGRFETVWVDPSTYQVEFVGIEPERVFGRVWVVPARGIGVSENAVNLPYSKEAIEGAPRHASGAEIAEVEKQQITRYFGMFTPLERTTPIEEVRPEESVKEIGGVLPAESRLGGKERREDLIRREQAFFQQNGFVTDSMEEIDASKTLKEAQEAEKRRPAEG